MFETARLTLRRFTAADAPLLFDLDSDPEVMRFISGGRLTPMSEIEEVILPRILSYYARPGPQGCWAAHLRPDGQFIGWFHLREDRLEPAEMELGYRLKRQVWGQGLATEGSAGLIEKGFGEWRHDKISARTLVGNLASRRVMEKVGLRFEGEFVYGIEVLPGTTEAERRGVKYGLRRPG